MVGKFIFIAALLMQLTISVCTVQAKEIIFLEKQIQKSLNKFCTECHDEDLDEGKVRLDNFESLKSELKFETLNKIEEQIYLEHMPPEKEKKQPSSTERKAWLDLIKSWNELSNKSSLFRSKLGLPHYGNYVDHDKLFSGEFKNLKGFTYDRRWLISEFIFKEKMNSLFRKNITQKANVKGKKIAIQGLPLPEGLANPFLLPSYSGIRYYANEKMNSGHLKTMIGNSDLISSIMIDELSVKFRDYLPAVANITAMKNKNEASLNELSVYLKYHIDTLCMEIYKSDNERLLPEYKRQAFAGIELNKKPKLNDYFVNQSRGIHRFRSHMRSAMGHHLNMAIKRYESNLKFGREKFIRSCEKYWCQLGLSPDTVERLVKDMHINLETIFVMSKKDKKIRNSIAGPAKNSLDGAKINKIKETIKKLRKKGMSYNELHKICVDSWREELDRVMEKAGFLSGNLKKSIIEQLYMRLYERSPSENELSDKTRILQSYSSKLGVDAAVRKLTQTLLLSTEFINRNEYGVGKPDQYGRRLLSPRDASYAIAYALTDSSPDEQLAKAAREGRLNNREDYRREILRILKDRSRYTIIDNVIQSESGADNITNQPVRKVRFFREFFGYYNALKVFKDEYRFGYKMQGTRERLIAEADMLVEYILENDKNVFGKMLTTDEFYVFHNGDNKSTEAISDRVKKAYTYFKKHNWKQFKSSGDLEKHSEFLIKEGMPGLILSSRGKGKSKGKITINNGIFEKFICIMCDFEKRFEQNESEYIAPHLQGRYGNFGPNRLFRIGRSPSFHSNVNVAQYFNIEPYNWDYPVKQPFKVANRMGMLSHPAWLQAFSQNTHTDPVIRGKWIREKLLAGTIPDVPIGVEAVIPEDHTKTLRSRLKDVTEVKACWKCHKLMNPLGNAFEMYDDLGRFRTNESLEAPENVISKKERPKKFTKRHPAQKYDVNDGSLASVTKYKTLPVDSSGVLQGTGDKKLDGKVRDAHEMIARMAKSDRVRQSIIRHTFRYFMGRNEMLSDSKTLMDADEAYLKSGGSFDAVIVSLLTSDSFIYRKEMEE